VQALFDTNILIDYLNGMDAARTEYERHERRSISVITWAEVLVGVRDAAEEQATRGFLATFDVAPADVEIAEEAVRLRRERRIRLPDALVWATARRRGALLITRNTKDFPSDDPGVRIPYTL
jgi:predicted nucleic acid-binding protein